VAELYKASNPSKDDSYMYGEVGSGGGGLVDRQVISADCRYIICLLFGKSLAVRGIILNKFEGK
jgi:hypothetical protein